MDLITYPWYRKTRSAPVFKTGYCNQLFIARSMNFCLWYIYCPPILWNRPLVLRACLIAGVNLCHCQYNAPGNNYLLWPSDKCYVHPSLLFCPGQPSFLGVRISPIATKVVWRICVDHIQLWAVAVCKLPSQSKLPIILTNIRQVLENIVPFLGLSKRVFS